VTEDQVWDRAEQIMDSLVGPVDSKFEAHAHALAAVMIVKASCEAWVGEDAPTVNDLWFSVATRAYGIATREPLQLPAATTTVISTHRLDAGSRRCF